MNQLVFFAILLIFLWLGVLTFFVYKFVTHYQRLIAWGDKQNLLEILNKLLDNLALTKKDINNLKKELEKLIDESKYHIQKVGILRFNPFADTGGDQSFILSILNAKDTGIVLTSLHSRGITRWYAKNVKEGKGVDHELSKEELEAIEKSVSIKMKKK